MKGSEKHTGAQSRRREMIDYYNRSDYVDTTLMHSSRPSHVERKLRVLRQYIRDDGRPIVELGCGAGVYANSFPNYVGLDISMVALRRAVARPARVVCCDIRDIPLADSCVGAVFSFNVLEHVAEPDRVLEEVDRILGEGGVVLLKDAWRRWDIATRERFPKWILTSLSSIRSRLRMLLRWIRGKAQVEWDRLIPDYSRVGPDVDAISGIDEYSVFTFFQKRGYEAINLRRNMLLRLVVPYSTHKHWVIVKKIGNRLPTTFLPRRHEDAKE